MKYADPSLCPGCREHLPTGTERCPHCFLLVRHALAQQLFTTLTRADDLVAQLRTQGVRANAPAAAPTSPVVERAAVPPPPPPPTATTGGSGRDDGRLAPRQVPVRPAGVGFAAVPKILLGLGALCLLVTASIFLAVTWDILGVAGRTAILLGFTAAAGGASVFGLRHGFRIAAEAFAAICLGLVALDLGGAYASGWFGDLAGGGLAILIGATLVVVGSGFAALTTPHLGVPQVAAALGALLAWGGALAVVDHELLTGHLSLVLIGGLLALARTAGLKVQLWSLLVVGGLVWTITALIAVVHALIDPTLADLWWHTGAGWSLLVSAAALLAPALILRRQGLLIWSAAGAAVIATFAVTVPAQDETARIIAVVALATVAAWTAVAAVLPRQWHPVPLAPAITGSGLLGLFTLATVVTAVARWGDLGTPFSRGPMAMLSGNVVDTEPLVVAPAVALVVTLAAITWPRLATPATWLRHGGIAVGAGAILTLACHDVPLVVLSTAGLLLTLATGVLALTSHTERHRNALGILGLALAALGCVVALPSATLTAVVAAAALAMAASLHLAGGTTSLRVVGGVGLGPAAGLTLAAGLTAADVAAAWVGVPTLLLVGIVAIARPRGEVEVPAVLAGLVATLASVPAAEDIGGSLALHLAVAGALCAATSLIHGHRRSVLWPGLALLTLASWVRLADLEVTAPEPYTLPLAAALTGVGLWHLRRDPQAGTMLALLPGLALGTVPSLLWVLGDPVSLRALALGAACVALAITGGALRWSAPLLVGSVVGTIVVLRELGPYASNWPQLFWIGLAGTLLTVVGITWERRLLELRTAVGMLGRLR